MTGGYRRFFAFITAPITAGFRRFIAKFASVTAVTAPMTDCLMKGETFNMSDDVLYKGNAQNIAPYYRYLRLLNEERTPPCKCFDILKDLRQRCVQLRLPFQTENFLVCQLTSKK